MSLKLRSAPRTWHCIGRPRFPLCLSLGRTWEVQARQYIVQAKIETPGPQPDRRVDDRYTSVRDRAKIPRYPVVLAHGLFGFDELYLAGQYFPAIHYWRGITEVLRAHGVQVYTASVPPSGSIEHRALKLSQDVAQKVHGKRVNIVAHSMGGLDSRYMISHLKPTNVSVASLTTVASPHHGSAFADYMFENFGPSRIPRVYRALESIGFETGAFSQLTRHYMNDVFNPATPDHDDTRYFSYGAEIEPAFWSVFRHSHRIVEKAEGPNDGLVSVASAHWGNYVGTLKETSHLDLINWTNRVRRLMWKLTGYQRQFDAIAFYLNVIDMLADEGL